MTLKNEYFLNFLNCQVYPFVGGIADSASNATPRKEARSENEGSSNKQANGTACNNSSKVANGFVDHDNTNGSKKGLGRVENGVKSADTNGLPATASSVVAVCERNGSIKRNGQCDGDINAKYSTCGGSPIKKSADAMATVNDQKPNESRNTNGGHQNGVKI